MDDRYEAWNSALIDEYFPMDGSGELAYLPVDDDEIRALAKEAATPDGADPVEDFVSSVCRELASRRGSFASFAAMASGWRNVRDEPTYVAALALCVLAASRMEVDRDAGIASHNYYVQLNRLIGREDRDGPPAGFERLRDAWEDLATWLRDDCSGRRGESTIKTSERHVNIGYPLSQCLLRASDRRRLPDFFSGYGLEPGSQISDQRLFLLLQAWASKPSCRLTARARNSIAFARDTDRDEIAETVARELAAWDGQLRDKTGRRKLSIRLLLVPRRRRVRLSMISPAVEGASEGRWRLEGPAGPTGEHVDVCRHPFADEWFAPLEMPVSAKVLSRGLTLILGEFSMVYEPSEAIPFAPAPIELNGYLSEQQVGLSDKHLALVSDRYFEGAVSYLRPYVGEPVTRFLSSDMSSVPKGWTLSTEFSFRGMPPEAPDAIDRLRPRQQATTALSGGLRLGPDVYLTGGEPDAQISSIDKGSLRVEVDDVRQEMRDDEIFLQLSELDLAPGQHELRADVVRRFSSVDSFGEILPDDAGTIAHRLERTGRGYVPASAMASEQAGDLGPDEVALSGAVASAAQSESLPVYGPRPVLLRAGSIAYVLLGESTDEVFRVSQLDAPEWLKLVRLDKQFQFIEARPGFDPHWLLLVQSNRKRTVRALSAPPRRIVKGSGSCDNWISEVLAWRDADVEGEYSQVWGEAVSLASGLRSEGGHGA